MNEGQQFSSMTMGTVPTHCGVVQDAGSLDLGDSVDSLITLTLTLFLSSTTPRSVSLFPISLAFICKTLNVLSSLVYSVGRVGDRGGKGVGGAIAATVWLSSCI